MVDTKSIAHAIAITLLSFSLVFGGLLHSGEAVRQAELPNCGASDPPHSFPRRLFATFNCFTGVTLTVNGSTRLPPPFRQFFWSS